MDNRLASLRRVLRIHINWLTVKLLGKELVTKEELAELKNYGRLSLGDEIGLVERSFVLGRISALSKKSEYKEVTLEKLSRLQKRKYSSVEDLAIREAKLHAARRLQLLADDAEAGVAARVNKATQDLLADAVSKDILKEELVLALAEKKTRKQLASTLGNKLGTELTSGFKKLVSTEMHRAKQRGIAMAISNKVDIYEKSAGVSSNVSVVPNKGACKDCLSLYLTEIGNPKVFLLKELVGHGTNADEGVSHARGTGGLHVGWKPVMPPAHPNCFCELVYVPPGMGWLNGRLVVTDEFRYKDHISKAVDKGSMSATIKPPGPKSTQGFKAPSPPSMPGIAAPGNEAGPGRPADPASGVAAKAQPEAAAAGAPPEQSSGMAPSGLPWEYYGNRGGQAKAEDGWKPNPKTGAMRRDPADRPAREGGPPEEAGQAAPPPEDLSLQLQAAKDWVHTEHTVEEQKEHLTKGEILRSEPLGAQEGAVSGATGGATRDFIKGNGSAAAKPALNGQLRTVKNERAAYNAFTFFGLDECPVTDLRVKKGELNSSQAWADNHTSFAGLFKEQTGGSVGSAGKGIKYILDNSKNPDKIRAGLENTAVMDMFMNNQDRHLNNFMVDDDFESVKAIDHNKSFGRGFERNRGMISQGFAENGMKLKLPAVLKDRFEKTSLNDLARSLGDDVQNWEVGQCYLRMQYILHTQEKFGELPAGAFSQKMNLVGGRPEYENKGNRQDANELFEDFALDFLDEHGNNPDSPEHGSALILSSLGVFMPPGAISDYEDTVASRKVGAHVTYEKVIRVRKAVQESINRGDGDFTAEALKKPLKTLKEHSQKAINEANKTLLKLQGDFNSIVDIRDKFKRLIEGEAATATPARMAELLDADKQAISSLVEAQRRINHQKLQISAFGEKQKVQAQQLTDEYHAGVVPKGQEKVFERLNSGGENRMEARAEEKKTYDKVRKLAMAGRNRAADIEVAKRKAAAENLAATAKAEG